MSGYTIIYDQIKSLLPGPSNNYELSIEDLDYWFNILKRGPGDIPYLIILDHLTALYNHPVALPLIDYLVRCGFDVNKVNIYESNQTNYMDRIITTTSVSIIKHVWSKGGRFTLPLEQIVRKWLKINHIYKDLFEKYYWILSIASEIGAIIVNIPIYLDKMSLANIRKLSKLPAFCLFRDTILKGIREQLNRCSNRYDVYYRHVYLILLLGEDKHVVGWNDMDSVNLRKDVIVVAMTGSMIKKTCSLPIPLEAKISARLLCSVSGCFYNRAEMSSLFSNR